MPSKTLKHRARPLLALALAAITPLTAAPALAQTCSAPAFRQPPIYPVGSDTRAAAAADFDGDGRPDLAVTDVNSNSVTVLTRVARDFPAVSNTYPVGRFPLAAAAGDFNSDGKTDLVVGNNSGFSVTLLLNDGAGRFLPGVEFPAGGQLSSIAVADINSDGKPDLVIASEFGFRVTTLSGDGQGGFGAPFNVVSTQQPKLAITADFNSDGKTDIAVASLAGIQILLGNGAGSFATQASTCAQTLTIPSGLAAGDLNADGKTDLVMSSVLGNDANVLPGNGSGCFGAPTTLPGGSRHVALADLNADGKLDIVQGTAVRLGDGSGGFGARTVYGTGSSGAEPGSSNTVVADFDADGKQDVATAGSGTAGILFGDGAGGFRYAAGPSEAGAYGLAPADFNGDGKPDLALLTNGNVTIMQGDGAGGFSRPSNFPAPFPIGGPAVADFNRDGRPDVATIDTSHTGPGGAPRLSVLPGDGAGGLGSPVFTSINDNGPIELAAGDFNSDGNPDLLTLNRGGGFNNGGSAFVSLGDGAGHFTPQPRFSVDVATNPRATGVADFNGDGKPDAAVPSGFGFSILRGDGAGGFAQPVHYITANASSVAVSDFNGDGKADLALVPEEQNGKVSVVLGDGAGGFGLAKSFTVGFFPSDVTAGDFNGDGKPDLAVANARQFGGTGVSPSSVSVLLGDGAGNFGPAATLAADRSPRRIIAGDFNADGLIDLVTANQGANNVSVLLNTCGAAADATPAFQFGASLYRVGEGAGSVTVTVTRTGSTSGPASVRYATSDGTASSRSDYITALGTLRFADGESAKTFSVLVVDDASVGEGEESLRLTLSDPVGATLGGTTSAVVAIQENDPTFTNVNPIDNTQFFVRQHYLDFLNREPDASGLQFWVNEIESCGSNTQCLEVKRINVSAAFFLSIEFQETGYLVYRIYKAAYGDATSPNVPGTVPVIRLNEFLGDTQEIGRGVIVGQNNWEQLLEANKQAYTLEFVQRQRFLDAYPSTMTAAQFVAKLNQNAGLALTQAEADQVASALATQGSDSAQARSVALRAVAESATLRQRETSRAFVLMQYYGYLRRNPDDAPETGRNFAGWKFWLDKLEQFNGNFVQAEMVKAFITSAEYRQRFLN